MLEMHLTDAGTPALYTREPGGTAIGEAIRDILQHDVAGEAIHAETEMLLFEASRAQLVRDVIVPALECGTWVICDRYIDSTTAYQGYGRGFSLDQVCAINAFAIGGLEPDMTILMDIDIEEGFARIEANGVGLDRIESEAREFHQRVRDGYLKLATKSPERFRVVNAALDSDVLAEEIWGLINDG